MGVIEAEIIEEDPYGALFHKALKAIEERYVSGAFRYGERKFSSEIKEILLIEDKLNGMWKKNNVDKDSVKEFRELLKRWYYLHLNMIEKYKKQMGPKLKNRGLDILV